MALPESRILSTKQLIQQISESNFNNERFCFILGSGASVESGIPCGGELEMQWMDCIMGEARDRDTSPMDPNEMRECARKLYQDKLIEHPFEEIETAWRTAKEQKKWVPSAYYFDIYKLRFYPNPRNGYRYLERIMEKKEPSIGYHTLTLMLTGDRGNNLVITTNFDSLVEDALFLYTDKKPLIVSHESLAGYIESDIKRPIIAKVHRGLMYAPFNSPETTRKLKDEWREALDYAFSTYTPIVIGYGGGDHSLMTFLAEESTKLRHGIYWCYRSADGLPEQPIQELIERKNGYFVEIDGFDSFMMQLGLALYEDRIRPFATSDYLKEQYEKRVELYGKQWNKLDEKPQLQEALQQANAAEQQETEKRKSENTLTALDYLRQGNKAYIAAQYDKAIEAYTEAIKLDPTLSAAYYYRSDAYGNIDKYDKAVEDCTTCIKLDPKLAKAFRNRAYFEMKLGHYDEALEDNTTAITLDPEDASAYFWRGCTYDRLKKYPKAIENFTKAIELEPTHPTHYRLRASVYRLMGETEKAEADEKIAKSL